MDDIIDFSPSTSAADRRLRPTTPVLVGIVAALTAGGCYLLGLVVPPPPAAAPSPTSAIQATAPTSRATRPVPALTVSPGAPTAALAAIPVRHETVATGTTEVMGEATGPVGFAAIAGPGRFVVDLLCLGHGMVSVTLGDAEIFLDESIHSPAAPTTRISCTDPATALVSAEVEIVGTSLAVKLDPDPTTVGGIAWRISQA
jgi:hypothetical protein